MSEIIFTCGGSMSNNMALLGSLDKGDHFITSSYEHPAILKVSEHLDKKGIEVTLIKPNKNGTISSKAIERAIKDNTKLISIMYINNEIGTVNPITEIATIAKKNGILMHTDAVQAMGKIRLNIKELSVDMMSLSGHKFYAPKGIGILFIKEKTPVKPIFFGGGQESQLFSGTENVISIGALAEAFKISCNNLDDNMNTIKDLDNYFISLLNQNNINYKINGGNRIPGILNITIPNTQASSFIINLDKEGYAISAGSACASGSVKGSHTLREIGLDDNDIERSYRISFGKFHKKEDVKNLFQIISKNIKDSLL
jgi:cysteine desulfurase